MNTSQITFDRAGKTLALGMLAVALGLVFSHARAAQTDIASAPLATSSTAVVKPNLMFILDDSGSMDWDYMPDHVNDSMCKGSGSSLSQCQAGDPPYFSPDFNGVYYNPDITYSPAINADGTSRTSYTTWTAVPKDAYGIQFTGTTDLTTGYTDTIWCNTSSPTTSDRTPPFSSGKCKQPVQGTTWTYPDATFSRRNTPAGSTNPNYYRISSVLWCSAKDSQGFGTGSTTATPPTCSTKKTATFQYPKYGTFTRTDIVPGTASYPRAASRTDCSGTVGATGCSYAEEMTNFANWYAYYRTRMQMMKTAAGRAFKTVDDRYRVGFVTINPGSPVTSIKYLQINTYDATQKGTWYTTFYNQNPNSSTPLRQALARVGRYFAGKQPDGMNDDPMQYSCQQNFTILSTDGFWNGSNGVQLDGTTPTGNWDNSLTTAPRPLFDGSATTTEVTLTTTKNQAFSTSNCGKNQQKIRETTTVQQRTVVSIDGVVQSDTTTTISGPNRVDLTACSSSPGNLQNPNPLVTTSTTSSSGFGFADTLADVAQYYYINDLRAAGSTGALGTDVSENNVPGKPSTDPQNDSATWQHMTTFTLGLGVDGTLTYASDYRENPTGDFKAIKDGTKNWPLPVADTTTAVDDLWHAAVNGRGKYFSARNPSLLTSGLGEALAGVNAVVGAAAAAATSNLEPVAGDNFAYVASYETVRWNGEVEARTIDLNTGAVGTTPVWSAQTQLDTLVNATTPGGQSRSIKRFNTAATNKLQDFTWANLSAAEQAYFQAPWIGTGGAVPLSQWSALSAAQQTLAAGSNLVSFLRGDSTYETQASNPAANQVYRDRLHVLGDIINAQPVYVKQISANYTDAGYTAPAGANFKECVNTGGAGCTGIFSGPRASTVYISANDGTLHAFNGDTGAERWAFIPNILLPKLYKLADVDYANRHQYLVDGTPTVGDVYDGTKWRTILVGSLNSGGRGYYALDVTDPLNPIGLWEFSVRDAAICPHLVALNVDKDDCDLGLSYGNPVISKLGDGSWVVMVASGYNNTSPGDGKGYLYVLDPVTGVIKQKIKAANAAQGLDPGDTTTPLGLAKINNWVNDTTVNNTTLRVYGADMLGNLWRFNTDTGTAYALATLTDPSGNPQPVTTRPELGEVNGKAMVYVATGRYIGTTDLPSTQVQTIYGIKDDTNGVAPATPVNARGVTVVAQTLTNTTDATGAQIRTVTNNPVDLTTTDGWRVNLPLSGERVNIDPKLQLGTLVVGSNVPANNACSTGGFSFLNSFDYKTGSYIPSAGSNIVGVKVANSLLVGINIVRLPNDKTVAITTTSDNQHPTLNPPFSAQSPTGRRSAWRELPQ